MLQLHRKHSFVQKYYNCSLSEKELKESITKFYFYMQKLLKINKRTEIFVKSFPKRPFNV